MTETDPRDALIVGDVNDSPVQVFARFAVDAAREDHREERERAERLAEFQDRRENLAAAAMRHGEPIPTLTERFAAFAAYAELEERADERQRSAQAEERRAAHAESRLASIQAQTTDPAEVARLFAAVHTHQDVLATALAQSEIADMIEARAEMKLRKERAEQRAAAHQKMLADAERELAAQTGRRRPRG